MITNTTLIIRNLEYRISNFELSIDHLEILQGKKILLLGESGSGKSTLMKLLNGFDRNYKGSIMIGSQELKEFGREDLNRIISYMTNINFFVDATVEEFLNLYISDYQINQTKANEYIKAVSYTHLDVYKRQLQNRKTVYIFT